MNLGSIVNQSLIGMQRTQADMTRSAMDIVHQTVGVANPAPASSGLTDALVNLQRQQHLFDASARMVNTADQLMGALIDTQA